MDDDSFEKAGDDHIFCTQMADELYRQFEEIEDSSEQIEQIINIYLKNSYAGETEEIVYSNLAVNTFNYMVETD